ncbi:MAG: hypothetical protein H0V03_03030 [Thermoleophilaceae bacterium]|nr:hypothetical protein [Thermoleophilaceae bacterium]
MLFDLQGKRRRVVQGTYLMLAILMGGGLVLFGIGGDVQGGLFDAFRERNAAGGDNSIVENRIEAADRRLAANPRDQAALKDVIRGNYQLAAQSANPDTGIFTAGGKADLREASAAWTRYLALDPSKPDDSLAGLMVQAYVGLEQYPQATRAAEIVARARPSAQAYLQLSQLATQAGQARKADLAGERAVELAPRAQRRAVRTQLQQIEAAAAAQKGGAGG